MTTPRQRFLNYVRDPKSHRPIVSPFLPAADVIAQTLDRLGLPRTDDFIRNEITLSRALDYEPMFMTECTNLIFAWQKDIGRSNDQYDYYFIPTAKGDWQRRIRKDQQLWDEESGCPVQSEKDHELLVQVCEQIDRQSETIRDYFRRFRQNVGENGVIVLGHPHPSWLGYQISPQSIFYHWHDFRQAFQRSMEAIYQASLHVMDIAMSEGIDFMSDSSYGLEMTSPELFMEMDLPYIRGFSDWTHDRNGLFWYHNCGYTARLIQDGTFDKLGADVIETIAPPPEGDNDLAASRRRLDAKICSKGNFNLTLLREGQPDEIERETHNMVQAVRDYAHIFSTADAVLPGTKAENFIAFVTAARQAANS
jgi:hypothetical protein